MLSSLVGRRREGGGHIWLLCIENVCVLTPQCFPYIYIHLTPVVGARPVSASGPYSLLSVCSDGQMEKLLVLIYDSLTTQFKEGENIISADPV